MNKKALQLFLFFVTTSLCAQYQVTIEATILDNETKQPIAFANIGFVERNVGTVSNEDGYFKLVYDKSFITNNEILQISTLGYATIKVQATKIFKVLSKEGNIYLNPEPLDLDAIELTGEKRMQKTIGTSNLYKKDKGYWYWRGKEALGGEIATRMDVKKKNTKLLELQLRIRENLSDSIRVRINIYNYKKGHFPKGNLLSTNIYHMISKKEGKETINLRPFNISVNNDIVIGIELVEVYGDKLSFAVAGNNYLGPSYTRYISQASWRRNLTYGVNFSVLTSIPTSKNKEFSISRFVPERITMYWDTSLPMKNRLLNTELEMLSNYLKKIKTAAIEVVKFSAFANETKQFNIENGKSADLIKYLRATEYDGASDFATVLKQNNFEADAVLLFTRGNTTLSELQSEIYVPVFSINTSEKANHLKLQKAANYGDGHYINLDKVSSKLALESLLNEVDDKTEYTAMQENSQILSGGIIGTVSSNSNPIQGATVRVKNSFIEVETNVDGNYQINADEGDILIINYLGMLKKEVFVSNLNNINIALEADGELLDEVIVTGNEVPTRMVKTAYGEKNFDALGYDVDEITDEDITDGNHTLDQIVSKLPGIVVSGWGVDKRYSLSRSIGSSWELDYNPIIVIDDMIYVQDEGADFDEFGPDYRGGVDKLPDLSILTIKSVRLLKSLASTNRYGTLGRNGVIVIETENSYSGGSSSTHPKPSLLVVDNDYTEEILGFDDSNKPNYISQLEQAVSFEAAKIIYKKQRENNDLNTVSYVLDVSDYFMKWDRGFASNVLSNIMVMGKNNTKALLTIAFKLEEKHRFQYAKIIYERIAKLRPKQAQVYRDLALIYVKTKDYEKAMELYGQMLNNTIVGVDFSGLQHVITSELKHLLAKHRSKVDFSNVHADYLQAEFKYDVRIVFDWNDASTEFEVQFVNPKKKFFTWSQTKLNNRERMIDGITKGYHTEEFIIDDDEAGEWIINIESLNEEPKLNPTYLKYTVFRNYGLANETKEAMVINLNTCKPKITFDKLINQ